MEENKQSKDKLNKIKEKLKDSEYVSKIIQDHNNTEIDIVTLSLIINQVPESYARERKGRGKHFYNPKADKMKEIRSALLKTISKEDKDKLDKLFSNEDASYYVYLDVIYYLPIQKSSSIKDGILKEMGLILPEGRPDIDNYDKFILDTLHEIAYDDDSHVVRIHSEKRYSLTPRTEIGVQIKIIKE